MSTAKPTPDEHRQRAVIYSRVSDTHGRDDDAGSFEQQEECCLELVTERGYDVVGTVRDPDRKGSTMNRPGLNAVRRMVQDGEVDVVLVRRFDRFGRTMLKMFTVLTELVDLGADVVSWHPQERLLDTSTAIGRGILALIFSVGEEELDKLRANWRYWQVKAIENGWYMTRAPLGYIKSPRQPLTPHPTLGPVVTELFERAAAGQSRQQLRAWLMAEHGIERVGGDIATMLSSRVYLGELHWSSGRRNRAVVFEPVANLHAHPPLTDEITWRRAQRNGEQFGLGREKRDPRLLAGLARCAGCRSTMRTRAAQRRRNGKEIRYYSCRQLSSRPGVCSASAHIQCEELEAFVEEAFEAWLDERDRQRRAGDDGGNEELRTLDARIEEVEAQILDYRDQRVQEALGGEWLPGLLERQAARDQLTRRRDALLATVDPQATDGVSTVEDYRSLDVAGRRAALARAIDIVFVRAVSKTPGASGGRAPTDARVVIVWRPDGSRIVLPRAGVKTDWRPFLYGDEPEAPAGVPLGE